MQGGHPVLKYSVDKIQVKESLAVEDSGQKLSRTITVSSAAGAEVWSKIADGVTITKVSDGLYVVNDKEYYLLLPEKVEPLIRKTSTTTMEMLLPVKLKDNSGTIKYDIIW
jgi:hypothetical protein